MSINETVLEMHFHRPLMELFRETIGLGTTAGINFYKYSPQRECFIGFDQAFVKSELTEEDFFQVLKQSSMQSDYKLRETFIGYFLQFKVVKEMRIQKKYTPTGISSIPHYRVSLDTTMNMNTEKSQHELLYNLNINPGAMVYYACPMLFDRSDLYEIDVNLDTLRLAEVDSCPSAYLDNEKHFIYFDQPNSIPIWCSEPVKGTAITPRQLAINLKNRINQYEYRQSALDLLSLLGNIDSVGADRGSKIFEGNEDPNLLPLVGEALTIIRVTHQPEFHPTLPV